MVIKDVLFQNNLELSCKTNLDLCKTDEDFWEGKDAFPFLICTAEIQKKSLHMRDNLKI